MTQAKHTPGPWHLESAGVGFRRPTERAGDFAIVSPDMYCPGTVWGGSEEQQANARLIAAAPELWEVARSVASIGFHTMPDRAVCMCTRCELVRDARAVLAKIAGATNA